MAARCAASFTGEYKSYRERNSSTPRGAVIQNAKVTVTNTATGVKASTTSDAVGQYTIPFLLPGTYSVTVDASGFTRYTHADVVRFRLSCQASTKQRLRAGANGLGSDQDNVHWGLVNGAASSALA